MEKVKLGARIELAGRTYIVGRIIPHFVSGDTIIYLTDATQDKTNQGIVWASLADVENSLPGKQESGQKSAPVAKKVKKKAQPLEEDEPVDSFDDAAIGDAELSD